MHASIHQAMYSTYGMLLLAAWLDMPAGHYSLTRSSLRCHYVAGTHATMLQGASPSTTPILARRTAALGYSAGYTIAAPSPAKPYPRPPPSTSLLHPPPMSYNYNPTQGIHAPLNPRQSTTT